MPITRRTTSGRREKKGTDFNIKLGGNEYDVHVPAPGVHNVYNALAALAAGHELGVPAELLVGGIAGYTPGNCGSTL